MLYYIILYFPTPIGRCRVLYIILYYICIIYYFIVLYYIGVGGDPWPISSLGALDGGSDRDKLLSVCLSSVCRLSSVCPPPATHPRPTRDPPQQMGRSMDRSRIDPGFYHILHDFTRCYTKIDKIRILARIFAPARITDRPKYIFFYYILYKFT